jgi:hypothetical protein
VAEGAGDGVGKRPDGKVAGKGGEPVGLADGAEEARDDEDGEVDEDEDESGGFDGGDGAGQRGGRCGPGGGAEGEDEEYDEGGASISKVVVLPAPLGPRTATS